MKNVRIALDIGRSVYKGAVSNSDTVSVTSGLAPISMSEYERGLERADNEFSFMQWNGNAYVIGDEAVYYRRVLDQSTADRYRRDSIGVVAANMILRLLEGQYNNRRDYYVDVVISHPPRDASYREQLKEALLGDWQIEAGGNKYSVSIERVWTEDEPVAILMNTLLTADGTNYKNPKIAEGPAYVLDGGGITIDAAATLPNGKINQAIVGSEFIGVNDTLRQFEVAIKDRYPDVFQSVKQIDPYFLREAFSTGVLKGGKTLDVRDEAKREREAYLNGVQDFVRNSSQGLVNYTTMILGGGFAALFRDELLELFNHDYIIFADDDLDEIHTAGVRGMLKESHMWEAMGLIS